MANGTLIHRDQITSANLVATWTMLDAVTSTSDGVWIDYRGFSLGTLEVSGITTATLRVRGSNATTKPDDTEVGTMVGSNITADGFTTVTGPYRWLKVDVAVYAAGTITATLTALTSGGGGGGSGASGSVSQGTNPWVVAGASADNSANSTAKEPVIPAVATASAPSYTEGRQVPLSTNLAGAMRVFIPDSGMAVDYYQAVAGSNQDANQISSSTGTLYGLTVMSTRTTPVYVKLYESASPTSTMTPKMKFSVSGADASKVSGLHANFGGDGIAFATAIGSRFTTGFADSDANAVSSSEVVANFYYR